MMCMVAVLLCVCDEKIVRVPGNVLCMCSVCVCCMMRKSLNRVAGSRSWARYRSGHNTSLPLAE